MDEQNLDDMATTDHFRLLDLPLELQRKIFKAYFGNWSVEVTRHHNEDHTACYNTFDGPSFLAVLVANRHIHLEAKPVLWSTFDRTLYIGGLKLDDDHSVMQKLRSISPEIETLELEYRTALSALEAARGFDFSKLRLVEFLNDVQDGFLFSRRHANVGCVGLLNGQLGEQFAEEMFFETEVCHYGSLLSDMAFVKDDRNRNLVYRAVFLLDILRQWRGEANHYSLPADLMVCACHLNLKDSFADEGHQED